MGSKNLKAIAVRGTKGVGNIANPKEFMKVTYEKKKILAENGVTGQGLPTYGTQVLMNVINEIGALPTRNHRDVQFEGAKDISRRGDGHAARDRRQEAPGDQPGLLRLHHRLRPHPARWTRATSRCENKPQYWGASGGLEYEAAWALGAANGVNDLEALQYANLLCNEHGMDPITFGATIGAVMELYEMGVLTKEQIGIDAKFGSAAGAGALCRDHRQGRRLRQGDRPGLGKRLTAKYGHPELSMTRQGPGVPGLRLRAASRAWAWPTPPATAAPATCAATRWPPRCWASRSRPTRSPPKASPNW